ncbi:MAG: site-2 protease family protein, partial [Hydrogenophaga sp.]|nr:site-2 protease family protein [Hydrogenophaga sp.]
YAARHFGDPTAWQLGRITLNPVKHIDPVGTIAMPLLLYFATAGNFLFGYAKPVPVNFGRLRNPKRDMVWVALAGPGANLIQAIGWLLGLYLLIGAGLQERFWLDMCRAGVTVNLVMFAFNLFPLPPLDGGRILVGLLPYRQAVAFSRIEPFGFFIVLGLVITGLVGNFWLRPLMNLTGSAIEWLLTPIRQLLL